MKSASLHTGLSLCIYIFIFLTLSLFAVVNAIHVTRYLVENPSEGIDIAYAICVHSDVLYVVGSTNYRMFVEGISISNNSRLFSWISSWVGELYDCVIVNSSLFVVGVKEDDGVGKWFIGLLNEKLNLINWRTSYDSGAALSVVYSGSHLYVVGYGVAMVDDQRDVFWIVERVDVNNISSYIYTVSNPSNGGDVASAVGIDPASGGVWVAGIDASKRVWRIEVYDRDLKLVASRNLDIPNYPYSIVFDSAGNTYIAGTSHVIKIDRNLNIVAEAGVGGDIRKAVLYNDNHLLLVIQHSDEYGFQNNYIYVLDEDFDMVDRLCVTCGKNYSAYIDRGKPVLIGRELYVAGYGIYGSSRYIKDSFIILYSIQIPENLPVIFRASGGEGLNLVVLIMAVVIGVCSVVVVKLVRNRRRYVKSRKTKKR